jgi:anaerobic ribonucleoside-triphosphate reductase activating protein
VQGCTLGCPGCFNPETHPAEGGELIPVEVLFQRIYTLGDSIEGISISGGEPLQQFQSLVSFLRRIRQETTLTTLIFTGFSWDEIQRMSGSEEILTNIDVLVAGRFDLSQPTEEPFMSSTNQTVHFLTDHYTLSDLAAVPPGEMIITSEGELILSGTDGIQWDI